MSHGGRIRNAAGKSGGETTLGTDKLQPLSLMMEGWLSQTDAAVAEKDFPFHVGEVSKNGGTGAATFLLRGQSLHP